MVKFHSAHASGSERKRRGNFLVQELIPFYKYRARRSNFFPEAPTDLPEMLSTVKMKERKLYPSLFYLLFFIVCVCHDGPGTFVVSQKAPVSISVGVILDIDEPVGRMSRTSIDLALEDFYASHPNYSSRLQLQFRDSKKDVIVAASEGNEVAPDKS